MPDYDSAQYRKLLVDEHYARLNPEPMDVIEAWGLQHDHYRASALAYIARAPHKANYQQDLIKAAWYCLRAAGIKCRAADLYALESK